MLKNHKIKLIFTEIAFLQHYQGQPLFYDIAKYLANFNYKLYDFYDLYYNNTGLVWGDALFYSGKMKKLGIVLTHPVQYYFPVFKQLSKKVNVKVFYTWHQWQHDKFDKDFGKTIEWDINLLDGYDYEFVPNEAKKPGIHHFFGITNKTILQRIRKFNPDAILIFGWNYASHMRVMRHFKGKIPVWFRGDSTLLDYDVQSFSALSAFSLQPSAISSFIKFKLRRIFLTWVYRHIDKAFYVGTNNKAYYLAHSVKEKQLVYAPHAIDNERFFDDKVKQYEQKAAEWRKELGFNESDIVILFAGKFEPKKNPIFLIKAFLNLSENQPHFQLSAFSFQLLLVGNGPLEPTLKKLATGSPNIHFLPFQNQSVMPVVYRLGDIFCLPSQGPGETWGLAMNEAMACNRPILVSNKVGGSIDVISEGENGFIFQSNDRVDFQKKLAEMVPSLKQMGRYAGNVTKKFSFTSITNAINKELNER